MHERGAPKFPDLITTQTRNPLHNVRVQSAVHPAEVVRDMIRNPDARELVFGSHALSHARGRSRTNLERPLCFVVPNENLNRLQGRRA